MDTLIPSLSQLIEFAVAPVFLLTGIAGFLNVMSSRLGRISDRVRVAERQIHTLSDPHIVDRSKKRDKSAVAQDKGDQLGDWAMRGIRAYGVHRYHGAFFRVTLGC